MRVYRWDCGNSKNRQSTVSLIPNGPWRSFRAPNVEPLKKATNHLCMGSCGAERKNIYLHIFYLLCLQLADLESLWNVLSWCYIHLPSSQLKPTTCRLKRTSMQDICEHHVDKARTPSTPQEKSEHLLQGKGKYCNELWRKGWVWEGGLWILQRSLCAEITTRCSESVQTGTSACLQFPAICQI